jgi:hypothetical protein
MDKEFRQYVKNIKRSLGEKTGFFGVYRFTLEDVITGEKTVQYFHNVITDVGLTMIANNLTDPTPTNDMLINFAALGTNVATVAEGNETLGTETYRNAIASMSNGNKVAYATAYFNQTEVTGTFKEAGIFCDATGAADSGILLSHVNIDVTKTITQKLTVDWTLTLANATP